MRAYKCNGDHCPVKLVIIDAEAISKIGKFACPYCSGSMSSHAKISATWRTKELLKEVPDVELVIKEEVPSGTDS